MFLTVAQEHRAPSSERLTLGRKEPEDGTYCAQPESHPIPSFSCIRTCNSCAIAKLYSLSLLPDMHADFRILLCRLFTLICTISAVQAFYIPGETPDSVANNSFLSSTDTDCFLLQAGRSEAMLTMRQSHFMSIRYIPTTPNYNMPTMTSHSSVRRRAKSMQDMPVVKVFL